MGPLGRDGREVRTRRGLLCVRATIVGIRISGTRVSV